MELSMPWVLLFIATAYAFHLERRNKREDPQFEALLKILSGNSKTISTFRDDDDDDDDD